MKKIIILILTLLLLCSCGNKEKTSKNETVNENEQTEKEKLSIVVWNLKLEDQYDDINTWFTTRANYGDNDLNNHTLIYNREDLYNSEGEYKFVIDSYEKGGLLTYKNNYVGIVNSDGEVIYKNTLGYYTNQYAGMIYSNYDPNAKVKSFTLGHDYGIDIPYGNLGGGGEHTTLGFFHKDGYIIDNESWTMRDIFNEALDMGYVSNDDKIIFNANGTYFDISKNHFAYESIPKGCLEGYILIGKDNYSILPIPKEYTIIDYSNNIITCARINEYETTSYSASSAIYTYETNDRLTYSDYTYVNEEGTIIASGYDESYGFYEGYAAVSKNGRWGYIDKQGNVVVDFIFEKTTPICDGEAWVLYKGTTGILNIKELLDNDITINKEVIESDLIER